MPTLVAEILKWVLGLSAIAVVGAGAAFSAFQFLGKKWLEARFAERLERFKHQQNEEIERLRYRINALMDRTTKLHQHEFEVLPEVWDKLGLAFSATASFTARMGESPDLSQMGEAQLNDFLSRSDLRDWQIVELRANANRDLYYENAIFWHKLSRVHKLHSEFHNYFISKGIFIQSELKEKIRELSNMMYDAFRERELLKRSSTTSESPLEKADRLHRDGPPAMLVIEAEVQARLWEANKLD